MPTNPWTSFSVRQPAAITALGTAVSTGLSTVKTFLQTARTEARLAALRFTDPTDVTAAGLNAAIQAVLGAAETAVEELLDDTGAYALVVPLPKKGFVRLIPDGSPDEPGSTFHGMPLPNLVERLTESEQRRLRALPLFQQLTESAQVYRGGNAYFVRTVGESMFDARDSSRPKFGNDDYWAYAVIIGGAEDLADALPLAGYIERLIGRRSRLPAARGVTSMVPQNVQVSASGRERMVVIEWEPVVPSRVLVSYDDNVVRPVEFVVVRSTDFRVATCLSVADLFGSDALTVNQTGRFGAKVIAKVAYDGITSRWVDRSSLEGNRDYYYLVGFRSRVSPAERGAEPIEIGYDKLIPCGPVRIRSGAAPLSSGHPPDWMRIPSFATVFPPVERFLDSVLERMRSIARASQTIADINDAYIREIEAQVERYITLAEEFAREVEAVNRLLTMPRTVTGVAMKTGTGQGTAADFLSQLIRDFNDLSDPDRPSFDVGDEYVTGIVLLAVGPDPIAIARQLEIFQRLFGSEDENDLLAGINSIGAIVADLETEVEAAEAEANTFNPDMTPRAVGTGDATCDPPVPTTAPVFDASMQPVED